MLDIRDFFDEKEDNIPFYSGMDETRAYMRWLDMLLIAYDMINDQKQSDNVTKELEDNVRMTLRQGLGILEKRYSLTVGSVMDETEGIGVTNIASHMGLQDYSFFAFLFALAPQLEERYLLISSSELFMTPITHIA